MTLVLLSGLSAGVLQDAHGNVIPGRQVNVYARGTSTPVQVYSDSAGSSPTTQPLTTDSSGNVPGYVTGGVSVDIVDALTGLREQGEPLSANLVGVSTTVQLDAYYDSTVYANKTAAIQAAYAAAVAGKATLECQAGRVYTLDAGPLAPAPNSPIIIEGHGATWKSTGTTAQIINFARTADYDTHTNFDARDLTFDGNNITSGSLATVGDSSSQRLNFQHIYFRRCVWKNVPTSIVGGTTYWCAALVSTHVGSGETQTNMTDIRFEQCRMSGGNSGVAIMGGCSGGALAVEVYHDQIYVDIQHDTGVVPASAAAAGANVQIGSLGWGDYCEVRCIGANSADVGVEIDGMQEAHVWGRITDSWNAEYFARNFHAPRDLASQRYTYHSTQAQVASLANTANTGAGYQITATPTPDPGFGEVVLENCGFLSRTATPEVNGSAINIPPATTGPRRLTIVGTFDVSYPSINDAPGVAKTPIYVFLAPSTSAGFQLKGGRIRMSLAGTGSANYLPRFMTVTPQAGCTATVDLDAVVFASSLASVSAGTTRGLILGLTGSGGGTIRGRVKYLGWEAFSGGDTTPQLTNFGTSATVAIDGQFTFDLIDLRRDPVAAPVLINPGDNTNRAKYAVGSAITGTYPIASVAMGTTNFVSGTFTTATGNQYIGLLPAEIHFATGTGAAITAIDASKDGATYENVYTQASGAMAQSVLAPVENGDFIKVTFATTQPTTRVRFRRVQ